MPTLTIQVTDEVGQALARQARALLLGRRAYVRAILAAVAAEADHAFDNQQSPVDAPAAHEQKGTR